MKSILLLTILAAAITVCNAIPAVKVDRKDSIDIKTAEVQKTISTNAGQKTSGDARTATKPVTEAKITFVKEPEVADKLSIGARSEDSQTSKGQDTTEKDSNKPFQGVSVRKQTTDVQQTARTTKQTQAVKPVPQKTSTANDDLNKRSESQLDLRSTSERTTVLAGAQQVRNTQQIDKSTAVQTIRVETKKVERSSDKETSSSDNLDDRSEVTKSSSQGKTISVENKIKKASAGSSGQVSVGKKSAVEIQEAPQTSRSESDRSEARTTFKRTSSGENVTVGRPAASQAVSSQSSEENQGSYESSEGRLDSRNSQSGERYGGQWQVSEQIGRQKSSERSGGRSNDRSGKRSMQSSGGRRY